MTEREAKAAAAKLRKFWADRGYQVSTKVVTQKVYSNGTVDYAIRSDMLNGLPRGWRAS